MSDRSLLVPPPHLALLGLRAMKTAALGAGELRPGARRLLETAMKLLLRLEVDLDALAPIEPQSFAAAFEPDALREQIVRAMVVLTLVDGKPDPGVTARVRAFAAALGVTEAAIDTVRLFAEGHLILGRLDWLRRSHLREMGERELEHGVVHAVKVLLGARGLTEDKAIASRYAGLKDLPAGTLGRALADHYRQNGFSFPGEKGGFPESGLYHDLTHVLGGFGTDPLGELEVGAFTAGFRKKDPLFIAMMPLLIFCAEINVTPIPHGFIPEFFAKPGVAEAFFAAHARGAEVSVDLTDGWDFWPSLDKPLDVVRRELGVTPRPQGQGAFMS